MAFITVPTLGIGGLNKEVDPMFLGRLTSQGVLDLQFADGRNTDFDSLTVKKRKGLASFFSGIAGIPMLVQDFVDVNNKRWMVVVTTTKIYTFDEVALILTDRTPTGYSGSLVTPPRATTFQFKHYVVNGTGFWYWDAVAATYLALPAGSPTTAKDVFGFGQHLMLFNVVSSGGVSDVYKSAWSGFLDGTIWTSGDALSADIVDGADAVAGGAAFGRVAVLLKTDSIYSITPIPAPFFYEFDPRVIGIGCIATATIQVIPGIGITFLGRDDWYLYDTISVQPIVGNRGESVRKDILKNMSAQNIGAAFTLRSFRDQQLLLFIPSIAWTFTAPTYNVYVYNWRYRTLAQYDYSNIPGGVSGGGEHFYSVGRTWNQSTYGFNVSPYRFNDQSGAQTAPALIAAGATSGKIYRLPTTPQYTDDGNAYDSWVQTGLTDFGNPWPVRKMVNRVHILFIPQSAGAINVFLSKSDDGETQALIGPNAEQNFTPLSVGAWFQATGVHLGVKIDDASGVNYWEAKSCLFEVEPGGER